MKKFSLILIITAFASAFAPAADIIGTVTLKGTPPPEVPYTPLMNDSTCGAMYKTAPTTHFYAVGPNQDDRFNSRDAGAQRASRFTESRFRHCCNISHYTTVLLSRRFFSGSRRTQTPWRLDPGCNKEDQFRCLRGRVHMLKQVAHQSLKCI